MASVDVVVDKMEQQLRKHKEKVQDRHRGAGHRESDVKRRKQRMKFADFICREAILAELAAVDKEGAIREMVQSLCDAGKVDAERVREHRQGDPEARGVGQHRHRPRRGRASHQASQRRSPGRHGGGQQPRGRFRQPRRRSGPSVLPVDFASRSARRPLAGVGEHLPATSRRHVLPIPQAGQDAQDILLLLDEADNHQFGS